MRLKRIIALTMLVAYLFAVGAPVYAALTCHCFAEKSHTEYSCCAHCNHDNTVTQGRVHFEAPCCDDNHSTDVELYTVSSKDNERLAKRLIASVLLPAILVEPLVSVDFSLALCGIVPDEGTSSVPDSHVSSCGLRAPPVLV